MYMGRKKKNFITLGIIIMVLTLSTIPVMAFNVENTNRESVKVGSTVTFDTLTNLPGEEPTILTIMADDQLGAIVGAGHLNRRFRVPRRTARQVGLNITVNPQINVCGVCVGSAQNNSGNGFQRITFR